MSNPNQTIPTARQMTAADWQAERVERARKDAIYNRIDAIVSRTILEQEVDKAVDVAVSKQAPVVLLAVEDLERAMALTPARMADMLAGVR